MVPVIQTENLTHIYSVGTPFEHRALDGVDFAVYEGETLGVIGHTGSGKSTLIQHLNGLLKPSSGTISFRGENIWRSKQAVRDTRFKVGLVFQYPEYQLFEETVARDIAFGPKNMGLEGAELEARVEKAAAFVRLPAETLEKSPFELSGGQKRRVAIAGIIAMEPEVLILDEPTAGLDPEGRAEILDNIREYKNAGHSVVIVSHSMEEVAGNADRLVVMSKGRVAMQGTPAEVFARAETLEAMRMEVPEVTKIFMKLRRMGLDLGMPFTLEQARDAVLRRMEGGNA